MKAVIQRPEDQLIPDPFITPAGPRFDSAFIDVRVTDILLHVADILKYGFKTVFLAIIVHMTDGNSMLSAHSVAFRHFNDQNIRQELVILFPCVPQIAVPDPLRHDRIV